MFAKFRELRSAKAVMRYLRVATCHCQCGRFSVRRRMRWFCPLSGVKRTWPSHCICPLMTQSGHRSY